MRAAWGASPPRIDVYLRTGCFASFELQHLYPTLERFWPSFLGDVIVVLDANDHTSINTVLPRNFDTTKLSYRLVYEDVPCFKGKFFNQLSYLNLDLHTTAEFVVTFDADCALHSPVTPDMLFDEHGRLLLAHTAKFQSTLFRNTTESFTGTDTGVLHSMVTQPVPVLRSTVVAFREWMRECKGRCFMDTISAFFAARLQPKMIAKVDPKDTLSSWLQDHSKAAKVDKSVKGGGFCWMCLLSSFVLSTNRTRDGYRIVNLDDKSDVAYLRAGIHVNYEPDKKTPNVSYSDKAVLAAHEGLCRALGTEVVPECAELSRNYVDCVSFTYTFYPEGLIDELNAGGNRSSASSERWKDRKGNNTTKPCNVTRQRFSWQDNINAPARLGSYLAHFQHAERESRPRTELLPA